MKALFPALFLFVFITSCNKAEDPADKKDTTEQTDTTTQNQDTAFTNTIEFASLDELIITAEHYHIGKDKSVMVLCHQAGWSRGEYKETAPKFNAMGYNCIAIDQRSGGAINDVTNETAARAAQQGLPMAYEDAEQDIIAAINYAQKYYGKKVILLGSSYSSGLALKIAKENEKVERVLSFSPGEYYSTFTLSEKVKGLDKPTFITSAKDERGNAKPLFDVVTSSEKVLFTPTTSGQHGSRALWARFSDSDQYWTAVTEFLSK